MYGNSDNRTDAKDVCILFTDGRSNRDEAQTIPYAEFLRDKLGERIGMLSKEVVWGRDLRGVRVVVVVWGEVEK